MIEPLILAIKRDILVYGGDLEQGRELLQTMLATTQGANLRTQMAVALAKALKQSGRPDHALRVIENAIEEEKAFSQSYWTPEMHRLRGEILTLCKAAGEGLQNARCVMQWT